MHDSAAKLKFGKLFLIFLCAALLLTGLFIGVRFFIEMNLRKNHDLFAAFYSSAEACFRSGNGSDAYDEVLKAASYASTRSEWHDILGLSYRVSEAISDPTPFSETALKAASDLPGNEEFWALAIHGLLLRGEYGEACDLAEKRLKSERYAGLLVEAALRSKRKPVLERIRMSEENRAAILLAAATAEDDPGLFLSAGERTGDGRFFINASLGFARKGNLAEAFSVFRKQFPPESAENHSLRIRELGSLLAYDTRNPGPALRYLGMDGMDLPHEGTFLLLAGDICMREGKYQDAVRVYDGLISADPELSPVTFLNRSWLERYSGSFPGAAEYLVEGRAIFPDDIRLATAHARLLYRIGSGPAADSFLDEYTARYPENLEARLLKLKLSDGTVLPERYEAELWDLFYDHPESDEVLRFLGWYLFGKGDRAGLETFFTAVPERFSSSVPVLYFKGLYEGMRGNERDALESFSRVLEKFPSWDSYFNCGVLYEKLDMVKEAESAFSESLRLFHRDASLRESDPPTYDRTRARILAALAGVYGLQGRNDELETAASAALKLDPSNLAAHSLLKADRGNPE